MEKLKAYWQELTPEQQINTKKYGLAAVIILILLVAYYGTEQDKKVVKAAPVVKPLEYQQDLLEDDLRASLEQSIEAQKDIIEAQSQRLESLESIITAFQQSEPTAPNPNESPVSEEQNSGSTPYGVEYPLEKLPQSVPLGWDSDDAMPVMPREQPVKEMVIGGIGHTKGESMPEPKATKTKNIYLPPSFMEAVLLTGVEALTTQGAQANPEPIMIRVQAPAVLPNSVRADLKGCFVIANAFGVLAKERVDARVVSLSCMSHDGQAVIDQSVKGYLVDADGKKGLAGRVVSKAGANIARSIAAGVFEGFGNAIATSQTETSISALGATKVLDPDNAVKAGLGQGLKKGTDEIQKLFLDLARQAVPVIEVGATKKLTVVIQEGVTLEVKDYENNR